MSRNNRFVPLIPSEVMCNPEASHMEIIVHIQTYSKDVKFGVVSFWNTSQK
jgi:hypothetical protein